MCCSSYQWGALIVHVKLVCKTAQDVEQWRELGNDNKGWGRYGNQ